MSDIADLAIQKAAMALGSTDEWTDQETMIADFESRFVALRAENEQLREALTVAGAAMVDWLDAGYEMPHLIKRIDAVNEALLEDAPQ